MAAFFNIFAIVVVYAVLAYVAFRLGQFVWWAVKRAVTGKDRHGNPV